MGLFGDMRDRAVWSSYTSYVTSLEPILLAASARGLPVSREAHHALSLRLKTRMDELYAGMQTLVPEEARQIRTFKKKPPCVLPFKPSLPSLSRYMKFRGHSVPRDWKSGKETTREKELRRLAAITKDDLYEIVLEYRDVQTVLKNHLKNWTPGVDGRVHPVFYGTATGQLEARRPNVMNAPNHKASQRDFRGIVAASPGHTLLEFDYRGFHALYLAWESGDKDMERLVRLDIHSYMTAHFLKLPHAEECLSWDDSRLREYLADIKREHRAVRDSKVKHALLGYNNGMGYRKLFNQYREFFSRESEAKRILSLLDSLFPKADAFRKQMRDTAHEQGFLVSKFGCVRYFWEVYARKGDAWKHGDDAEAAISYVQQNHAHCHLKDVMRFLDRPHDIEEGYCNDCRAEFELGACDVGWLERARFLTPIHDSLLFECPDPLVDAALPYIRGVMEAPNQITGLSVGVEIKRGPTWNKMCVVA